MSYTTRQELDIAAIRTQLQNADSGPIRDLFRRGLRVQTAAKRRAPANTGRLRQNISIATEPREVLGISTYGIIVGTDVDYAPWVHNGTGLWGPRHAPILPKRGKVLVFETKGVRVRDAHGRFVKGQVAPSKSVTRVFTRSVRGQAPNPFLKLALHEVVG